MAQKRGQTFSIVVPTDYGLEFLDLDIIEWAIGQEERSDEGFNHYQLMVRFNRRYTVSSLQRILDLQSIEVVRDCRRYLHYVTKVETRVEGTELIEKGVCPFYNKKYGTSLDQRHKAFSDLLDVENRQDAIDLVRSQVPDVFVLQNKNVMSFIDNQFATAFVHKYTIDMFNTRPVDFSTCKTHIFIGPTGMGKTAFALAHFIKPLLISDKSNFGQINDTIDGIVIDDMSFHKWSPTNLLTLCDAEYARTVNIKYGHANIPAGLKRIFTLNSLDLFWPEQCLDVTKAAIERRIKIHDFSYPLFGFPITDNTVQDTTVDFVIPKPNCVACLCIECYCNCYKCKTTSHPFVDSFPEINTN